MKAVTTLAAVVAVLGIASGSSLAQGRVDPRAGKAGYWAKGLEHFERSVRLQAIRELTRLAGRGDPVEEALPILKKCMNREVSFPTTEETDLFQIEAIEILALVEPDFVVEPMAKLLAANITRGPRARSPQTFALKILHMINRTSVDIDVPLMQALAKVRYADPREQKQYAAHEGKLLYVFAKLAKDRNRAGKLVVSRMHWPLGRDAGRPSFYSPDHFKAVRLCAEQAGSLLPKLQEAYRADAQRDEASVLISALAVYHDEAWDFMVEKMQDPFLKKLKKPAYFLTAYADTWLLAPEETQKATLEKIADLSAKFSDWGRWGAANYESVPRLLVDRRGRLNREDILVPFRDQTGYAPSTGTPPTRRSR